MIFTVAVNLLNPQTRLEFVLKIDFLGDIYCNFSIHKTEKKTKKTIDW